ncbi:UDP-N-acetylmuramoylalanyl-D-glutamate--2,6-diaminopimelate ligase [Colwellia chukchiensis]|uniref:UDP-N-acetylmuramoyl-L-alanyl-D-glutamate--2,6-diaminopimelate ligase n=1 Tax=Colwellia chukchiensis TaxID=641665 RepID=A0A1H7L4Y1_9GAMM|nr:UDP-N-acetylmuramoyl-L-alanyl-D-glutamate--2,6-diaminopimelate ligase [Colwellia chukchiensis]SEK94099.1 UDP-N-acetylmuramoylalanyl-D-glutamate--2,6-diaminopimelate ligase [Colwellia chukchiensis]
MSDHALYVYSQPESFAAIEAALHSAGIKLAGEDLAKIQRHFSLQPNKTVALVNDTRAIHAGDVFCAVIGSLRDGRAYVAQALAANCGLIFEETKDEKLHGQLNWQQNNAGQSIALIKSWQLNDNLFALASAFYGAPSQHIKVIGITGTNGKTSTSQIIASLLDHCQQNAAVIGTNGAGKLGHLHSIENTTPGATELQHLFCGFAKQNISHVAMEVSSHALAQKRVHGTLFSTAVFTNLSRDHLDYHQTMSAYAQAKKQIFSAQATQMAVINGDDQQAQKWLQSWPKSQPVVVYGRGEDIAHYSRFAQALAVQHHTNGVSFQLHTEQGQCHIRSALLGDFNVENLLAAIAVLIVEGFTLATIAQAIKQLEPIMGRMEAFNAPSKTTAVIDYAHTPEALASALDACRLHCQGKLWLVFGCGGDRDVGKRPLMAQVAEAKADQIIITNDNPRSESPEAIARDIMAGFSHSAQVETILDRRSAVLTALTHAHVDDVVLCAGKGHEDYIIVANEKHHYDERALVNEFFHGEAQL